MTDRDVGLPITSPIILVGDGQVELFADAPSVEVGVEAIDAQLYQAFDSLGRVIRLAGDFAEGSTLGARWVESGRVSLQPLPDEPPHVAELQAALLAWWQRTRGIPEASTWSLAELIAAIATRDGVKRLP